MRQGKPAGRPAIENMGDAKTQETGKAWFVQRKILENNKGGLKLMRQTHPWGDLELAQVHEASTR
jgi:hypothetical protein